MDTGPSRSAFDASIEEISDTLRLIWYLLLLPWLLIGTMSGMAFDGGPTFGAYVFVGAAWTYPVSVLLMHFYAERWPKLILLPAVNIMVWFLVG